MGIELNNNGPLSPVGAKLFGADAEGNVGHFADPRRKNTCVIFGDSITAQNTILNGSVTANTARFFAIANAICGQRLELLANAGISSNTTTQMLARIDTDVLAYKPGYVVVLGGTNDKSNDISAGDESTAGTTIYNLKQIFDKIIKSGAYLFACTLMTRFDLVTNGLVSTQTAINNWIKKYVSENVNCSVVDFASAISSFATGLPATNYTIDGLHPSAMGSVPCGTVLAEAINRVAPKIEDSYSMAYDSLEYIRNPGMAGANADGVNGSVIVSGTTGTMPNGMQSTRRNTGEAAFSQIAVPSGAPGASWRTDNLLRCAATFAADNDGVGLYFGGSDVSAKGRYDQTWAVSTAYTYGDRRKPTVKNGLIYAVVTPGTSGSSAPDWTAHVAGDVVTDGTCVWLVQKRPETGDKFYAECEVLLSGLTASKGALPVLTLVVFDTTSTALATATGNFFDLTVGGDFLPTTPPQYMRLRTPVLTIPDFGANALRYLRARIMVYGDAGGTATMDIGRIAIKRVV